MSKGTVGKVVIFTVVGGILALCTKSCVDGYIAEANFKRDHVKNTKPTTSNTDSVAQPTTLDVTESSFVQDYSEYVNDDIYNALITAKDKFDLLLYGNSSISEKMLNNGVKMNVNDSGYIDNAITNMYNLICGYINSYQSRDFNTCYSYALQLNNCTYDISSDYLYDLLVRNNLDDQYQSPIKRDQYGNLEYRFGNISLENGKQIRFIGGDNSIVENNNTGDFSSKVNWLQNIPSIIFDKFIQINNSNGNDVCYIVNYTKVSEYCFMETNNLLKECASLYNVDVDSITINELNGEYVFVSNGNELGLLDYNQKNRYEMIKYINSAITSGNTDCLLLDSYVSDLYNKQTNNYNK